MKTFTRKSLFLVVTFGFVLAARGTSAAPLLPNPVLFFIGAETQVVAGQEKIRYLYDVFNKDEYPKDFFEASPNLPPCGTNRNAARTWVDLYDQSGKKLNSFCALAKPSDLNKIWFSMNSDAVPPSWVYIEMTDRKTNTKYKSNLADTTL